MSRNKECGYQLQDKDVCAKCAIARRTFAQAAARAAIPAIISLMKLD